MTLITVVVGNPKPGSRTLKVCTALAESLFPVGSPTIEVIDLAEHVDEIFSWPNERMKALNDRVAESDVAIFGSPTYKASYTGLLKAFLDRYPANGLAGVTAIPVLTGADSGHSMAPTVNLTPLLLELGAVVPGRGFYFVIEHMDRLREIVGGAADEYRGNIERLAALVSGLGREDGSAS